MKNIIAFALVLSVMCVIAAPALLAQDAAAPAADPKAQAAAELNSLIEKLGSNSTPERAEAAFKIGNFGLTGTSAIPALIAMIGDEAKIGSSPTTPGGNARKALAQIGPPAVKPLALLYNTGTPADRENVLKTFDLMEKPEKKAFVVAISEKMEGPSGAIGAIIGAFAGGLALGLIGAMLCGMKCKKTASENTKS